jgi:hypothetical protein
MIGMKGENFVGVNLLIKGAFKRVEGVEGAIRHTSFHIYLYHSQQVRHLPLTMDIG